MEEGLTHVYKQALYHLSSTYNQALFFSWDFVYPKAALNSKIPIPSAGIIGKHQTGFSFFGFETCLFVQPWLSWISVDWVGSELSYQPAYSSSMLGLKVCITTTQPKGGLRRQDLEHTMQTRLGEC